MSLLIARVLLSTLLTSYRVLVITVTILWIGIGLSVCQLLLGLLLIEMRS